MDIKVKLFTGKDIAKLEKQINWFLLKGDKKNKDKNWIIEIKHAVTQDAGNPIYSVMVLYK